MSQQVPWLAAGRYEVGEVVGRGGYGMVCRGVDRKTGEKVALKMLSPEAGRDPDLVARMLREQQALVALSGTCAVTAIDLCRLESGAPCLVMEWLDGRDLEQQLAIWEAAGERGPTDELLAILRPLTQTLERAHQIGIVHRDIKPANIFLASGGVRLLDFGLSRMKSAAPLTAVGIVMGSPSYIAPETWRGNSATLDGRADLFALGVIVFRWLTGALPFDVPDLIGKMTAVTSGPRPSVVALRPELAPEVDVWTSRALAVEPTDRFQTGGDFCEALAAALRGEPWHEASADVSGVRAVAASTAPARKNALASAWSAAASLLKRFTGPREGAPATNAPAATPPATTPPAVTVHAIKTLESTTASSSPSVDSAPQTDSPPSERQSIWLDSTELEELLPEPEPAPPSARDATATRSKRKSDAKPKTKAQAQPKKSAKRAKAAGKGAKKSEKPKRQRRARKA